MLQGMLLRFPRPPSALTAGVLSFESRATHLAVLPNVVQHTRNGGLVLLSMAGKVLAGTVPLQHSASVEPKVLDGQEARCVRPVLEEAAAGVQCVQPLRVVCAE